MASVFEQAYNAVEGVDDIVSARIADAAETSASLQATALDTINALKGIEFNYNVGPVPQPPNLDVSLDADIDLPPITPTSFGSISSNIPERPQLENVLPLSLLDIPEFESSIGTLNIPEPPAPAAPFEVPERPVVEDIELPAQPDFELPQVPTLADIDVPDFEGLQLPVFSAEAPEFEETALPGILQWEEPTYHPQIMGEVLEKIRSLWSGTSGIPPSVEQAMLERAMSREDNIAKREINAVATEFSSRGFTMPSGMQAARTDQMRQDLALKKLSLNRELTIKFAEWQIENIRFGVQNAIAAENVYVNLFLNSAQRLFEAARYQIESQLNIYNAQVALFNARMNKYQAEASVFQTLVQAELSKLEAFKAEVEAEVARGQVNEQRVRAYSAQVEALRSRVSIYELQMRGVQTQTEIVRTRIEAYQADVRAYGERVQADKTRYEAYETRVRAETAKTGIIDAEARAYAALVSGKSTAADVDIRRAQLSIEKNRSLVQAYVADLDAERTRLQSQVAVIQSGAEAYTADTQRYAAQAGAETAKAQVEISAKETEMRTNIAFYQAQVQAYIGNMEQLIRQASLVVDALQASGQISSTLAAGAMAGVHVGASLSGSGALSAAGSYSEATSNVTSNSESRNYNYEGSD